MTAIAVAAAHGAPIADARTREQVTEFSADIQRAWAMLTNPETGAVTDILPPGPHATRGHNYGTFLLADAQLRTAKRTGDALLAERAMAIIEGTIQRNRGNVPADPFNQFAAASLISHGRAGQLPAEVWARVQGPVEAMARRFKPFTGHGFTDPAVFDNWRLVWAAGAIQLANAGIVGEPGSITEHPSALRAEVARIVNDLVPRSGGSVIQTPYGPGRALSDRPDQPLAYHVFSATLLEHIHETDPGVFGPEALAVREQMSNYALTLMAPDGDLTPSGRSIAQSWVLGCAADLAARRAAEGGVNAGRWRTFAERAVDRLVRVHGRFADGTIPVIPGLTVSPSPDIADHYSSMTQYNGSTLFFLQHAAERWPDHVVPTPLPGDRELLVSDLGRGGPALAWGRSGNVWWAIQGRRTRPDSRATQGIVALKVRAATGWVDRLAARPIRQHPRTDWVLRTRTGRRAQLELTRAVGTGRHAVITGRWIVAGRTYRTARWDVRVRGNRLVMRTEPLRRGERLTAAVWMTPAAHRPRANARTSAFGCIVSASGRACARKLHWSRPGRVRVS